MKVKIDGKEYIPADALKTNVTAMKLMKVLCMDYFGESWLDTDEKIIEAAKSAAVHVNEDDLGEVPSVFEVVTELMKEIEPLQTVGVSEGGGE